MTLYDTALSVCAANSAVVALERGTLGLGLRGARRNSGVAFDEIAGGLCRGVAHGPVADTRPIPYAPPTSSGAFFCAHRGDYRVFPAERTL